MSQRLHRALPFIATSMCVVALSIAHPGAQTSTQIPAPAAATPSGPTFDVVSIRRSKEGTRLTFRRLPTGGLIMTGMPLSQVIVSAYPQGMAMKGIPAWTRDRVKLEAEGLMSGGLSATATPSDAPPIFSALPDQLGLKLESSRAMVETLVVDRIERPSEN